MERLILEIKQSLARLTEKGANLKGWEASLYVPDGKIPEILEYFRIHTIISQKLLDDGKIMIDGVTLTLRERLGPIVFIDTQGDVDKQVRCSVLSTSEWLII